VNPQIIKFADINSVFKENGTLIPYSQIPKYFKIFEIGKEFRPKTDSFIHLMSQNYMQYEYYMHLSRPYHRGMLIFSIVGPQSNETIKTD